MDAALCKHVRERAGDRCEYCRLPQAYAPLVAFHIEHIRARQHGGSDDPSNLAIACPRCNAYKGPNLSSVDPQTGEVVSLFHPRTDAWEDHFTLRGAHVIGLSATGRATVRVLNMNAEERVKVREELLAAGEW
jgi:5-methylcytosine-specific restriction endonuclease McrA